MSVAENCIIKNYGYGIHVVLITIIKQTDLSTLFRFVEQNLAAMMSPVLASIVDNAPYFAQGQTCSDGARAPSCSWPRRGRGELDMAGRVRQANSPARSASRARTQADFVTFASCAAANLPGAFYFD
jgi:hypothetical protein